jgi:hypothetical protein
MAGEGQTIMAARGSIAPLLAGWLARRRSSAPPMLRGSLDRYHADPSSSRKGLSPRLAPVFGAAKGVPRADRLGYVASG